MKYIASILITTSLLLSTVYEDGEDKSIERWEAFNDGTQLFNSLMRIGEVESYFSRENLFRWVYA